MPNNKTVHVLKGMDRLENIMEKISIEVRVEVSKNGVKKEQTLNLSKINNGFIEVGYIYESKIQLEKENIKFVINKGKLAVNGRGLLDDKKLENIREYIK